MYRRKEAEKDNYDGRLLV